MVLNQRLFMLADLFYNLALSALSPGASLFTSRRMKEDPVFWRGRLGHYDEAPRPGRPRIWLHAVSVGEVTGAVPTIHALQRAMPQSAIYLTVGTPQGFRFARHQVGDIITVFPYPLDFPRVLARAFRKLQPNIYVAFESEFWPNLFRFLRSRQIPAILLNGRLSTRSARRYKLLKPLFQPVFDHFRWLVMHSEEDRTNILELGISSERTMVLGSSKYDGLLMKADPDKERYWRKTLAIAGDKPVIVGGSLRRSECTGILRVFSAMREAHPGVVGIFAPRHLEQVPNIIQWLQAHGHSFQFLTKLEGGSEKRSQDIVVVDRIGALFDLYSLGDLIFCGGTLEPIGGHNILEPAAWAKPVFYGPHLQKVLHEHRILRDFGGSFLVESSDELLVQWRYWIRNLPVLREHGEKAREALNSLGGVTARQVDMIIRTLSGCR